MRRPSGLVMTALLVWVLSSQVSSQSQAFRVLDAGPRGEIAQVSDANEIRVVFSEPMVAIGRVPAAPAPPWVHITPAIRGTFRWSGTTILIFTPDPGTPLPPATEYTVTIDGSASSSSGRQLGAPYRFTFTTPTPRLTSMRWYRRNDRFDRPVVLMLEFNQAMNAAQVAANATLRFEAHDVDLPSITADERTRLAAVDRAGLAAFDARITQARQTAARTDVVAVRVTTDWDRERFPPAPNLVALETTTVPPPGAWLALTLGAHRTGRGTRSRLLRDGLPLSRGV